MRATFRNVVWGQQLTVAIVATVVVVTNGIAGTIGPTSDAQRPLSSLPRLRKPHYSWPASDVSWKDASANPVLQDYARVTGSVPISVNDPSSGVGAPGTRTEDIIEIALLCQQEEATIAINYSPWYAKFKGVDPTVQGPLETQEVEYVDACTDAQHNTTHH